MPWTRQQVKYLLSSGSPLSGKQKTKMKGELHEDPSMGHMRKGYEKQKNAEDNARSYAAARNASKKSRG
jgi:hypothetical protein